MTREQKIVEISKHIIDALKPLLLYFGCTGFLMGAGMLIRRQQGNEAAFFYESSNFYVFMGNLFFWFLLYRKAKRDKISIFEIATLDYKVIQVKQAVMSFLLGVSAALFLSALITLMPMPAAWRLAYHTSTGRIFTGPDRVLVILMLVAVSPLTEEVVFRGLVLNRLLGYFDEKTSIILSAAVFGLCHVNPLWILYAGLMGAFLAKLSIKEDNILYCVLIHMGFNFPTVILSFIGANRNLKSSALGVILIVMLGVLGALAFKLLTMKLKEEETI